MTWYKMDKDCSELEHGPNRTLIINFYYDNSNAVYYLSRYASFAQRVRGDFSDIFDTINNEFANAYEFHITFFLTELNMNQVSSARAFRQFDRGGCMFTYYIDEFRRDAVKMDSEWYEELEDEYGPCSAKNYYESESDEDGYTLDTDLD